MKKTLLFLLLFLFNGVWAHEVYIANKTDHTIIAADQDQKASVLKPEEGQWYMAVRIIDPKNDYKNDVKGYFSELAEAKIATRKGSYTLKYFPLNITDAGVHLYEEWPKGQKKLLNKLPHSVNEVLLIINPDDTLSLNDFKKIK